MKKQIYPAKIEEKKREEKRKKFELMVGKSVFYRIESEKQLLKNAFGLTGEKQQESAVILMEVEAPWDVVMASLIFKSKGFETVSIKDIYGLKVVHLLEILGGKRLVGSSYFKAKVGLIDIARRLAEVNKVIFEATGLEKEFRKLSLANIIRDIDDLKDEDRTMTDVFRQLKGIVFGMLKQNVSVTFNERMSIAVPDPQGFEEIWIKNLNKKEEISKLIWKIMRELSKLNPQIHAQELYAAVNFLKRCPPGIIISFLLTNKDIKHLGDLYFRIADNSEGG